MLLSLQNWLQTSKMPYFCQLISSQQWQLGKKWPSGHSVWIGTSDCKWWNSWYLSIIQSKDYKKKMWNETLNHNSLSSNCKVMAVYWGRYLAFTLETRVQFPIKYFLFFSTFTLFCPFLEIFKGQKRGAYTTIYQWDQVQSTRILLYFYQN